jgi:hypothetical protein
MDRPAGSIFGKWIPKERLVRLAPFLVLGPVSGPLTAGIVLNFKGGRPVLAVLYAMLLGSWLVMAPIEAAHLLPAGLQIF